MASLVLAGCASAQDQHVILGTYGNQRVYRGYDSWVEIQHAWETLYGFTVSTTDDYVTAPGQPFKENDSVRFLSTDTLPDPLSKDIGYTICDLSGDRFRLVLGGELCSQTKVHFTNQGIGQHSMFTYGLTGGKAVYIQITGLPPGVTAEIWCEHFKCIPQDNNTFLSPQGAYMFHLHFVAAPDAQLGSFTVQATVTAGSFNHLVQVPLTVEDLVPVTLKKPASYPPIPNLTKWEQTMKQLGALWCNKANPIEPMYFGVEYQVWFYDGAYVYYQLADYTRDPSWRGCANNIATQYRDYVTPNNGAVPGWRVMPYGLLRASLLLDTTSSQTFRNALGLMTQNGVFNLTGGGIKDTLIRETAYRLETLTANERLTGIRHPQMPKSANLLLGMLNSLFETNSYISQYSFMDGLGFKALINYYELTRDPRVPVAIKKGLDYLWTVSWKNSSRIYVNPDVVGPRCDWGCRQLDATLINLFVPAYAWYWSITGDDVYRQRGDEMFSHSLDEDITYSGKIFSQNYNWSFSYVRWRRPLSPFGGTALP